MRIRVEELADHGDVRNIHLAAFGVAHTPPVTDLVDELRQSITPGRGISLVAEDGGRIAGHVMFTPGLLDAPRRLIEVQILSPLGVSPLQQGRGIGSALVRTGLRGMTENGVPIVFLEGDPGYYSRLGFRAGRDQGFRRPSLRIPEAAFQAIVLPAYQPWMTGTLVYPDVFWRHDAVGLRR